MKHPLRRGFRKEFMRSVPERRPQGDRERKTGEKAVKSSLERKGAAEARTERKFRK